MPTGCSVRMRPRPSPLRTSSRTSTPSKGSPGPPFYPSGDEPRRSGDPDAGAPPDGAPCGSATGLEIGSSGFNDWGSLIGYNNFGPRDGSARRGCRSGRTPPPTRTRRSRSSWTIRTPTTTIRRCRTAGLVLPTPPAPTAPPIPPPTEEPWARESATDPATGMVLSSGSATAPLPPNGCGNHYQAVILLASGWQLVTIPFGTFQQLGTPNRVPNDELTVTGDAPGTSAHHLPLVALHGAVSQGARYGHLDRQPGLLSPQGVEACRTRWGTRCTLRREGE